MVEVDRTVVTPERIGVQFVGIPADGEVRLDLRLESVSEGVLVTGTVSGDIEGQCGRCLGPLDDSVSMFLTELFAYPDSDTDKTTDDEDVERIVDEQIDLEQTIIDAVATELPLTPLCTPDCPGLCQVCGVRLADAEPGHGHELIDPRWAKLADKLEDMEQDEKSGDEQGGDEQGKDEQGGDAR
ncbi:YceD family protein [Gordonia zhaorongruii]|uniref:YceD family protein n=1 Tax=Gordonia zhaorongruii TaxID=2597659 RepID=UPI0010517D80|nr:YceD family protein [Gordonia zhaorongruii]